VPIAGIQNAALEVNDAALADGRWCLLDPQSLPGSRCSAFTGNGASVQSGRIVSALDLSIQANAVLLDLVGPLIPLLNESRHVDQQLRGVPAQFGHI